MSGPCLLHNFYIKRGIKVISQQLNTVWKDNELGTKWGSSNPRLRSQGHKNFENCTFSSVSALLILYKKRHQGDIHKNCTVWKDDVLLTKFRSPRSRSMSLDWVLTFEISCPLTVYFLVLCRKLNKVILKKPWGHSRGRKGACRPGH